MLVASALATAPLLARPTLAEPRRLLLDVELNGSPTGLVASFEQDDTGAISATSSELAQLRLPVTDGPSQRPIPLSSISGLTYRYDEARQVLAIMASPDLLSTRRIDASAGGDAGEAVDIAPSSGALLGYSLFVGGASGDHGRVRYSAASALLDLHVYGPLGEVRQTGLIEHNLTGAHALRLDSAIVRTDTRRDLIVTLGDSISGGPIWSNPVRLGGIQIQRDFSTRPDLVTTPLPTAFGTASVPSSLDLYVDGVKRLSTEVPAGRFAIDNLPAVIGGGTATLVLRDIQGREVRSATPFYVSSQLLRPGLTAYSLEAGFTRSDYGTRSFGYDAEPFLSGSGRFGLTGPLTIELHAELSPRLTLGGIGAAAPTGRFGVLSGAASVSSALGRSGAVIFLGYEAGRGPVRFAVQTRRTLGTYFDIAALSGRGGEVSTNDQGMGERTVSMPDVSDRATLSLPRLGILGGLSMSYAHERRRQGDSIRVGSLFYSRTVLGRMSFTASAFRDFEEKGRSGAFAGLSMPLGGRTTVSAAISREADRLAYDVEASQSLGSEPGSIGWRAAISDGDHSFQGASVDYQTRAATLRAELARNGGRAYGSLSAQGAMVLSRSLFFAPRLGSSFAVVDAKLPGVRVLQDNNPVGHTNRAGLLLVTNIRPFERNALSIDEDSLPLPARVEQSTIIARPLGLNGAVIRFPVSRGEDTALLHIVDEDGHDVPVGSAISINGGPDQAIGYDGLVLAEGLRPRNLGRVAMQGGSCTFAFPFTGSGATTLKPGPLTCSRSSSIALANRQ